jgi:hypothetical protein
VTLLVLAAAETFALAAVPVRVGGNISVALNGQAGQTYVLQMSTNQTDWVSIATNKLSTVQTNYLFPAGLQKAFFRARQVP